MVDLLETELAGMSRGYMRKGCSEGQHVGCEVGMDDGKVSGCMRGQRDSCLEGMGKDCKVLGWELGHDVANAEDCSDDFRLGCIDGWVDGSIEGTAVGCIDGTKALMMVALMEIHKLAHSARVNVSVSLLQCESVDSQ